jgi:hypothetical protein
MITMAIQTIMWLEFYLNKMEIVVWAISGYIRILREWEHYLKLRLKIRSHRDNSLITRIPKSLKNL